MKVKQRKSCRERNRK